MSRRHEERYKRHLARLNDQTPNGRRKAVEREIRLRELALKELGYVAMPVLFIDLVRVENLIAHKLGVRLTAMQGADK